MITPEIEAQELITDIETSFEVFAKADPRDLFDKAVGLEMRAAFDESRASATVDGVHVIEVTTEVRIGQQGQKIEDKGDDKHYDWEQPYDLVLTHISRYGSDEEPVDTFGEVKASARFISNKTETTGGIRIISGEIILDDGEASSLIINTEYDMDGITEGPEYDAHQMDMLRNARNTMNQLVGDSIDK